MGETKTIAFVCVHNAGRSQMAEAFLNHVATQKRLPIRGISAGTMGGKELNPQAVAVMQEIGIDMSSQTPKILTPPMVQESDRIITMGCGVDAAACPAKFYVTEDWGLDDPAGQSIEKVRAIRDEIQDRVQALVDALQ